MIEINERIDREPEVVHLHSDGRSGLTRRSLLTEAASRFALAASGLLVPAGLVERAAAYEEPVRRVQRRKEQRRQKRRAGDHGSKRMKRSKRDKGKFRDPHYGPLDLEIRLGVDTGLPKMEVQFYWLHNGSGDARWTRDDSGEVKPGSGQTYRTDSYLGFAGNPDSFFWINERYYIRIWNPSLGWPETIMGYSGKVGEIKKGDITRSEGWENGKTVVKTFDLKEPNPAIPEPDPLLSAYMFVDNMTFVVTRQLDSNYKRFTVRILNSPCPSGVVC